MKTRYLKPLEWPIKSYVLKLYFIILIEIKLTRKFRLSLACSFYCAPVCLNPTPLSTLFIFVIVSSWLIIITISVCVCSISLDALAQVVFKPFSYLFSFRLALFEKKLKIFESGVVHSIQCIYYFKNIFCLFTLS